MAWIYLIAAGLFEVVWAVLLKETQGFTRLWPSLACVAAMATSLALFGFALRAVPFSVAYAVWVGVGAVGTAVWGMVALGEAATAVRILCLGLILAGIAGLRLDHG